jgi:hypothetical protein
VPNLPAVAAAAGERASIRFLEFFAANIRNPQRSRPHGRDRDRQAGHSEAGRQTEGRPVSVEEVETEAISSAELNVRIHSAPAKSHGEKAAPINPRR